MPLTDEQQAQLAELERLRDEPEPEPAPANNGRMVNVNVDLGDPDQVERAFDLGLLDRPAPPADDPPGDDPPGDDPPRRRGFFPTEGE